MPRSTENRSRPAGGRRPAPALVVAFAALLMSLTGTAVAANTIGSADIRDGTVKSPDIANDSGPGALTGEDIAGGALGGVDLRPATLDGTRIQNGTLTGSKFASGSIGSTDVAGLTGADINESSLTDVTFATDAQQLVGPIDSTTVVTARGDSADSGECVGSLTSTDEVCADISITLQQPSVTLVTASGTWHRFDGSAGAVCGITTTFGVPAGAPVTEIGEQEFTSTEGHVENYELPFALHGMTGGMPAGTHDYTLHCRRSAAGDEAASDIDSAYITVLAFRVG